MESSVIIRHEPVIRSLGDGVEFFPSTPADESPRLRVRVKQKDRKLEEFVIGTRCTLENEKIGGLYV